MKLIEIPIEQNKSPFNNAGNPTNNIFNLLFSQGKQKKQKKQKKSTEMK